MSVRLAASLLAFLYFCAATARPARAGDDNPFPELQLIADAAVDVQTSVDDLKTALLSDGDPTVRSVFPLLNNLNARAHEIEVVSYQLLGDLNGQDIEAVAFLVLMEAARSAQEDLRLIMDDVEEINRSMAQQSQRFLLLQRREYIATATEDLVSSTDTLLDLFSLDCLFCED